MKPPEKKTTDYAINMTSCLVEYLVILVVRMVCDSMALDRLPALWVLLPTRRPVVVFVVYHRIVLVCMNIIV